MPHIMRIKRIHHLTVAVRDAERARATFEALFDGKAGDPVSIEAFGVRTHDIAIGEDVLQIAAPLRPDSPLTRFIERRGEGFYNLALEVEDLDAALDELAQRGIKVSQPIEAQPGIRSSFITMQATHGLSLQLIETVTTESEIAAIASASTEPLPTETEPSDQPTPPPSDDAKPPLDLSPDEWSDVD
jgi:hypothetical protein